MRDSLSDVSMALQIALYLLTLVMIVLRVGALVGVELMSLAVW